jgi:MFS family permease
MIFTLLLTVAGALSSALLPWGYDSIYNILAVCRFVLGLGVGGVYPLSATTAAESTENEEKKSKIVAVVFSFQGCGQLLAPMITFTLQCTSIDHEIAWRILLGLGAVPGLFVLQHAFESQESSSFCDSISKGRMSIANALRDPNIRDHL